MGKEPRSPTSPSSTTTSPIDLPRMEAPPPYDAVSSRGSSGSSTVRSTDAVLGAEEAQLSDAEQRHQQGLPQRSERELREMEEQRARQGYASRRPRVVTNTSGGCMNYDSQGGCMNYKSRDGCMNYRSTGGCMNYRVDGDWEDNEGCMNFKRGGGCLILK